MKKQILSNRVCLKCYKKYSYCERRQQSIRYNSVVFYCKDFKPMRKKKFSLLDQIGEFLDKIFPKKEF